MVCVRSCFLCIQLEPACFFIGIYYIASNLIRLIGEIEEFLKYEDIEKDDDAELIHYISRLVLVALKVLLGASIIFVTYKRSVVGLKICGCITGLISVVDLVMVLVTPTIGQSLPLHALSMIIFLYLAVVVFSFGLYLEEEESESEQVYAPEAPPPSGAYTGQPQQP